MNPHHETNPHFVRPSHDPVIDLSDPHQQHQNPRHTPTTASGAPWTVRPRRESRPNHRPKDRRRPSGPAPVPLAPIHAYHPDEQHRLEPFRGPHLEPGPYPPAHHPEPRPHFVAPVHHPEPSPHFQAPVQHPEPSPNLQAPARGSGLESNPAQTSPLLRPRQNRHDHRASPWMPAPKKTKAPTWFMAVFCFVLWIVVILGGLIVLTVYLVFRPKSPKFEVSTATLNAAYLDMGYLLNADLSLLANFTNPNQKVSVEFGYMFVELYYGRTLVATQHLEPFTARRGRNMLASLHLVTSQVRLAELEVQRIKRQALNNGLVFELKGYFRARSNFGSLLRYSYWLHTKCALLLTKPPGGVLVAKSCKTGH